MTMTEGQRMVWAARFERVQYDHMQGAMEVWHANRRSEAPRGIPHEDGERMFMEAVRVAVEQANSAVVAMSVIPPPAGQKGAMLREMLGILEPLRLSMPDDMPEPMDYSLPPPGWMFPEGNTSHVHRPPAGAIGMAKPVFIGPPNEAHDYAVYGEHRYMLFKLADAWREYMEIYDPQGYRIVDNGTTVPFEVRLVAARAEHHMLGLFESREDGRAFAWRCHERPQVVNAFIKLGKYLDKTLEEMLGWTDAQLEEALAWVQSMSVWESTRPPVPVHLA